ncbi:hypothetical protein Tco_0058682 [Tanacetum coccineum]
MWMLRFIITFEIHHLYPSPYPSSSPTPETSLLQTSPLIPSPSPHSQTQPSSTGIRLCHPPCEDHSPSYERNLSMAVALTGKVGVLEVWLILSKTRLQLARRPFRFVLSEYVKLCADDSSKQGRKFSNEVFRTDEEIHEK